MCGTVRTFAVLSRLIVMNANLCFHRHKIRHDQSGTIHKPHIRCPKKCLKVFSLRQQSSRTATGFQNAGRVELPIPFQGSSTHEP